MCINVLGYLKKQGYEARAAHVARHYEENLQYIYDIDLEYH